MQLAGDQHIAAAVDHGVVHAMLAQRAHAGFQDRQLGDPAQVQRHAVLVQEGGAGALVQHQSAVSHQTALRLDLLVGWQRVLAFAETPDLERTHGRIEGAARLRGNGLGRLEHGHDLGLHGHGMLAGCAVDGTDGAVRAVAGHEGCQALHFPPGLVHGGLERTCVRAVGDHVHLGAHQGAAAALGHRRCGGERGRNPGGATQEGQRHGHAPPGQASGRVHAVHGRLRV